MRLEDVVVLRSHSASLIEWDEPQFADEMDQFASVVAADESGFALTVPALYPAAAHEDGAAAWENAGVRGGLGE